MSVYRPKYKDPKTGKTKESATWWYEFTFAGKRIRESAKPSRKTVATEAEKARRRELELSFNGLEDKRAQRVRTVGEIAQEYLRGTSFGTVQRNSPSMPWDTSSGNWRRRWRRI